MRAILIAVAFAVAPLVWQPPASADAWKDESGKGWRDGYERRDTPRSHWRYSWAYKTPRGHLPPPGECRVWYPDRPAGHQPPPYRCR